MSYGIEIRNSGGDLVLDEENEVILVAEKNTIQGTRANPPLVNGSPSILGDFEHKWWDSGDNYLCCVYLVNTYEDPPIVALRGNSGNYNVLLPTVRAYSSTDVNTANIDRLLLRSSFPSAIDYIVCAGASDCPTTSKAIDANDNYGLQIKNSSDETIFDSRWAEIISCTAVENFPTGVDVDTTVDPNIPPPFNVSFSKTGVNVSIPSTPGAFMVNNSLSGEKAFYYGTTSGQGGEPIEDYGGGIFHPTLMQTAEDNILATSIRVLQGQSGTAGTQYRDTEYKGPFQVLRYLGF